MNRRQFLLLPLAGLPTPTPKSDPDIDNLKQAIETIAAVVLNLAYIIDFNAAVCNARLKRLENIVCGMGKESNKWQT